MRRVAQFAIVSALLGGLAMPAPVRAQVIIDNGTVALGINPGGDLITSGIGLTFLPTNGEALAPGCYCEGWGVSDFGTALSGGRSQSNGNSGNFGTGTLLSGNGPGPASTFGMSSGNYAEQSIVLRDGANVSILQVRHDFRPSVDPRLYEMTVTITNVSAATNVADLRYRRVMDWDVPPTTFNEYVTLQGFGNSTRLIRMTNNGFNDPNPNTTLTTLAGYTANTNVVRFGPSDHGAGFDFSFGALAAGQTVSFKVYYGAAANKAEALAALAAIGAEVYSLGEPSNTEDGSPNTFIFAFAGVGGVPILQGGPLTPAARATIAGILNAVGVMSFDMARARFANIQQRLNGLRGGAELPAVEGMPLGFAQAPTVWTGMEMASGVVPVDRDLVMALVSGAQAASGSGMMPLFQAGSVRAFLGASYNFGQFGTTSNQRGHDWRGATLSLGADVDVAPNILVGAAISYGRGEARLTQSQGSVDSDNVALTLYGSGTFMGNLNVDVMGTVGHTSYDIERINSLGRARASTESNDLGFMAAAAYNIEMKDVAPGLVFGPLAQVAYLYNNVSGYNETGQGTVSVRGQRLESLTARAGVRAQYHYQQPWGTVIPNVMVGVENEFLDGSRTVNVFAPTGGAALRVDDAGKTYMVVGAGLSAYVKDADAIVSVHYEGQQFREHMQSHAIVARGRMRF